ncbi:MAG: hypothetical protein ABT20_05350 [Rubrivivax sp. SCN 70-15]|nr:MAG: hypothetical protein ABT20_05350 [Rubrivivax sp. SCN 70-15]
MKRALATFVLGWLVGAAALAATPLNPKVMSDAPTTPGAWRMEAPGQGGTGGMTICQTAAQAMGRKDPNPSQHCEMKMVEDGASQAIMEVQCKDSRQRITITRAAPRSYFFTVQDLKDPSARPMQMKMSYVGPCSAKDSLMSLDKDSPACKGMQARLAEIDKAKASCAKAGDARARASCEQMMASSRAQMLSMCGQ